MSTRLTDDDFRTLASDVAAALGDGWRSEYDPDSFGRYRATLHGPDDAKILMWRDRYGNDGKLTVSGSYPDNNAYDVKHVKIGIGETRGAAVIAREIQRRLLPDYLPELVRIKKDNARRTDNRAARLRLAEELAGPIKGRVIDDARSSHTHIVTYDNGLSVSIDINHDASGGRIEVSSATADQLRAIIALLANV